MVTWRINKQAEERVRKGHPWVFAREIESTTKHHPAGHPIALLNIKGEFLGVGYGNPNSKILVRFLTLGRAPFDLQQKLKTLWFSKNALGFKLSMRWCFADSDGIPGLIIDRYLLGSKHGKAQQVLVVQKSTAGAEHLAPNLSELFQELCTDSELLKAGMLPWEQTSIIEKSDLNVRKLEGLELKPAAVVRATADFDASQDSEILVGLNKKPLALKVNFLLGQKTGFFLDQVWNAEQISQFLAHQIQAQQARGMQNTKIRILDLCCYVGQWGARLAQTLKELGVPVEIDLVDASEEALLKAKFNCELANSSAVVNTFKKDVLTRWDELPEKSYDIVVCDPPAFVKNVQDLQAGLAAYVKLNTQSLSRVKEGGMLVTASCSGAVRTHDFIDTLSLASQRSKTELQQFFCGGHGPDHTVRPGFPEGQYLKLFAYRVYHRPQE